MARQLGRSRSARDESGLFVVEGAKLVLEAHQAGRVLETVFVDRANLAAGDHALVAELPDVVDVAPGLLDNVGSAASPQPVLAVAQKWSTRPDDLPETLRRALLLVGVSDPGNAGTLLRSAEGSGIEAVLFAGESVDPFNPKVVRGGAGSLFRCPFAITPDVAAAFAALRGRGMRLLGTASGRGEPHFATNLADGVAIVLGNESRGLPAAAEVDVDDWVHIPTVGLTESLNVAMAGSILCFEGLRQQTTGSAGSNAGSLSDP